ncbi:MAG TPA: XRE family transcriptional regulator, partial [Acidobacteriaceae bacterium]
AGSGNVFVDLGFAEADEELTKAQLASHIRQVIRRRRLTQVAAAALMDIDRPKVSGPSQRTPRQFLERQLDAPVERAQP